MVIIVTVKEDEFFTLVLRFARCWDDFHLISPNAVFWINSNILTE